MIRRGYLSPDRRIEIKSIRQPLLTSGGPWSRISQEYRLHPSETRISNIHSKCSPLGERNLPKLVLSWRKSSSLILGRLRKNKLSNGRLVPLETCLTRVLDCHRFHQIKGKWKWLNELEKCHRNQRRCSRKFRTKTCIEISKILSQFMTCKSMAKEKPWRLSGRKRSEKFCLKEWKSKRESILMSI